MGKVIRLVMELGCESICGTGCEKSYCGIGCEKCYCGIGYRGESRQVIISFFFLHLIRGDECHHQGPARFQP